MGSDEDGDYEEAYVGDASDSDAVVDGVGEVEGEDEYEGEDEDGSGDYGDFANDNAKDICDEHIQHDQYKRPLQC